MLWLPKVDEDPERRVWTPGRRKFIFLGLGAAVAPLLPWPEFRTIIRGWDPASGPDMVVIQRLVQQGLRSFSQMVEQSHDAVVRLRALSEEVVPRASVEKAGLVRVAQGDMWHLSMDGTLMWRDPKSNPRWWHKGDEV